LVVGVSRNPKGVYHAFSWTTKSGMVALPKLPGGTTNSAYGINAAGLIVGASDLKNSIGNTHAVDLPPAFVHVRIRQLTSTPSWD
jgi:uncharacterized membrane protein